MSEQNVQSHTQSSTSGGAAERALGISTEGLHPPQVLPEHFGFRFELNATCLAIIEDYRSSRIEMAKASLSIIQELSRAPDLSEEQKDIAYRAFFEQLQEHDRTTAASAHRGRGLARSRPGTPRGAGGSDTDDREESPQAGVQPVSRKRALDDDGDRAEGGKRRVDESLIPFAQPGGLSLLHPQLQATLKLKENYTRNLEACKQLVISDPDVPEFPQSLWKDVLANNFIDLDKVLSGEYSTSGEPKVIEKFGDTGYTFTAGDLKASKAVRSHGEWTIAWNSYADAVEFAYPHRKRELRIYSAEINRLFGTTLLESADRVIQFDRASRSRAAKSNKLLLSDLGNFNDLSISHFSSTGAGAGKSPAKAQGSGVRGTSEICRRFNEGLCTARSCKFRHACFTCKARDHGSHSCNKASGSGTQPKLERK